MHCLLSRVAYSILLYVVVFRPFPFFNLNLFLATLGFVFFLAHAQTLMASTVGLQENSHSCLETAVNTEL